MEALHAWVQMAVRNCWHLLSSVNSAQLMESPQPEIWYSMGIWYNLLDTAFYHTKSIRMLRGEKACKASSRLRNQYRRKTGPGNRKLPVDKLDGVIIALKYDAIEFGAVEAAKEYDGRGDTKWIKDDNKLAHVLYDMLTRLHSLVDDEDAKKVQTVGVISAGRHMQMVRCWSNTKGGAAHYDYVGNVHQFPADFEHVHKHLWPVMRVVDRFLS